VSHTDDTPRPAPPSRTRTRPQTGAQAGPALTRRAFVGLAGAAGLGLAAGCSGGLKSSSGSSTGTIKIGYVSPRTGPDAAFTSSDPFVLSKVRAALAKGLTIGGKKYKIEIFTADSQSSDTRAAQVAQQLITQNNVDIMLTTSAPETVNPVSDQCESAHVPCLGTIVPWESWFLGRGGTIGTSAGTSSSFKYTYLYFIGLEDELAGQIPAWKELTTNHKVGGLWPSDADGTAFRGAFTKALPGDGYKVINPGAYSDGATDFTTIINKYKSSGAEIIQGCPLPPDFATFWKQSSSMGYKPRIACIAKAILFPSVVVGLGPLGENLLTDAWWTPGMPWKSSFDGMTCRQYANEYQAATGQQWTQPMSFNYAVFEIAAHVLRSVGDPHDHEEVAAQIGKSKGEVITGSYDFTSGPVKNVAVHDDFAGQWQKSKDPAFMYDLYVVNNAMDSSVPVTAAFKSL
jgi:branched-chain amino acid transport system substrate-binding protein